MPGRSAARRQSAGTSTSSTGGRQRTHWLCSEAEQPVRAAGRQRPDAGHLLGVQAGGIRVQYGSTSTWGRAMAAAASWSRAWPLSATAHASAGSLCTDR